MTHPTSGRTTGYQLSPPASAHDTITKVIKELRAYNPQADEHGGKFIHKGWANQLEAVAPPQISESDTDFLMPPSTQPASKEQTMTDTTSAAPVAWRVHPFDYGIGHEGVYAMTMLEQQRDAWLRKGWKVEPLYVAPRAAMEPLTADGMMEPKNGQQWRVEWWNESCRMMLPKDSRLDSFQSYKNGTLMFTIKKGGSNARNHG